MLQSRRGVEKVAILLILSQGTCETCKGKALEPSGLRSHEQGAFRDPSASR